MSRLGDLCSDEIGFDIKAPGVNGRILINRWRVKEGVPVSVNQVILLYQDLPPADQNSDIRTTNTDAQKLKAQRFGVVKKRLYQEGAIVTSGTPILLLSDCIHTTVIKDMCADCGADLRQNENLHQLEASVPMIHHIPELKVSQKLAQKLGHDDTRRLLSDRKLVLLVDLDQTIIHTTNDNVPINIKDIYHFQLYGPESPWYHTRLRPQTLQFLEKISKFYELHICTFGARNYAHTIAQILDPDGKFFSHRILSRDECFNATSKTDNLKALFPNGDSMVCIIDDREDVWNMASNLIQVKPYHFFQHTGDINAPPGLSKHELDGEGVDFKNLDAIQMLNNEEDEEQEQLDPSTEKNVNTLLENKTAIVDELYDEENQISLEVENVQTNKSTDSNDCDIVSSTETEISNDSDDNHEKYNKKDNQDASVSVSTTIETNSIKTCNMETEITAMSKNIEFEDTDDYLMYLEVILQNIHCRFYSIYDETNEIPDLKIIVPKIRSEVLRESSLVFSGLVPTNMKLQQSRAYLIAKSLGAEVLQNISKETTHLVAVMAGTFKVNAAKKNPNIKVVNANWLWTCAERWEHVEEKIFPLDRKMRSKQRQPPAHCHSPEHVVNYTDKSEISPSSSAQQNAALQSEKFIDTINPLLSFSNADLADMNKDFHQFFDSDSSSEDEHVNIENPPVNKKLRKREREVNEEERTRKFFIRSTNALPEPEPVKIICGTVDDEKTSSDNNTDNEEDDEIPSEKFRRGGHLPSDLDLSSDSSENANTNDPDDEDNDWNIMGAELEREFLKLN